MARMFVFVARFACRRFGVTGCGRSSETAAGAKMPKNRVGAGGVGLGCGRNGRARGRRRRRPRPRRAAQNRTASAAYSADVPPTIQQPIGVQKERQTSEPARDRFQTNGGVRRAHSASRVLQERRWDNGGRQR